MPRYLIAYDIADPKRLRQVARVLEQRAIRCQKSVFQASVPGPELNEIMNRLAQLIDRKLDRVQAWRIADNQPPEGIGLGDIVPLQPACLITHAGVTHFVAG